MKRKYLENYSIGKRTSFGSGGVCSFFFEPRNLAQLVEYVNFAEGNQLPVLIFGEGTNLLVTDHNLSACVISLSAGFAEISVEGSRVMDTGVSFPAVTVTV